MFFLFNLVLALILLLKYISFKKKILITGRPIIYIEKELFRTQAYKNAYAARTFCSGITKKKLAMNSDAKVIMFLF